MSAPTTELYNSEEQPTNTHPRELCTQTQYLPEVGQLTYSLLEEPRIGGERAYAITVRCNGAGAFSACRTIRDITTNRNLALRLFWQVCRGHVTPYGLLDILPELLP